MSGVNPYNLTAQANTVSEFSVFGRRCELRMNTDGYVWLRITCTQGSNYGMANACKIEGLSGAKATTLVDTTITAGRDPIYGTGDNWTVGSQVCTPAVRWTSYNLIRYTGVSDGCGPARITYDPVNYTEVIG